VRHRLVGEIVDAYGRWDALQQNGQAARATPIQRPSTAHRKGRR
jgi:phosphate starvation-inducible PhoH-like protein